MAFDVPKTQKVYTTVYDNFKGVDYTNDATNVYKRRTPTGYNMIPDLDGKPKKRTGWETIIGDEEFENAYQEFYNDTTKEIPANFKINKIHYFELCGCDHLMIFTNIGIFVRYVVDEDDDRYDEFKFLTASKSLRTAYDRTFFFEANGETGFYIYSDLKIWKYYYDEDNDAFKFEEDTPYVPTLRVSTTANGMSGTLLDSYNLLGSMVREEFQNNCYPYINETNGITTVNCTVTSSNFDRSIFLAKDSTFGSHHFKYNATDGEWIKVENVKDEYGETVSLDAYGIKPTNVVDGSRIRVRVSNYYRVQLANKVTLSDYDKVSVWVSSGSNVQFGKKLTVQNTTTGLNENKCALCETESGNSYIQFYNVQNPLVEGEDAIRVEYPCRTITTTRYPTTETYYTSSIKSEFDLRGLV